MAARRRGRTSSLYYVTHDRGQRRRLWTSAAGASRSTSSTAANALVESSAFKTDFEPCPSPALPDGFVTGEKVTVCQVYLVPKRGELKAVSFRPTEKFNPITWVGKVRPRSAADERAEAVAPTAIRPFGRLPGHANHQGSAVTSADNALPTSLTLGSLTVETPVVLAPMAGITNAAYRRLCAEQGAGLYVCEMITSPRAGRARRDHAEDAGLRRPGEDPVGPALRHRPGLRRQGRRDPVRRVRRRAHRPQLRLPGPQGDPQGRWRRAAVEARAARRDPDRGGRRRGAVRRARSR